MLKRSFILLCLLFVSAFGLVACGSGDNDESQIEEAVETSATTTDPEDCTKLSTQRFMEQTAQTKGSEAVKACEKEASEGKGADAVAVSNVVVDGSKATADTAITGGGFDGQAVEVALVKQGDQWKLDEVTGFTKFDKAKVIETLEREFAKPSRKVSKSLATCITKAFEKAPEPKFEEALLSPSTEGFEELAGSCF